MLMHFVATKAAPNQNSYPILNMPSDENKTKMTPSYDAMITICKFYYPFVKTKEIKSL